MTWGSRSLLAGGGIKMENNSISILLRRSRINLGELKSLLVPVACTFRCTRDNAVKVTFTLTPVDKATSQCVRTSRAFALPFPPPGAPEHALALSHPLHRGASRASLLLPLCRVRLRSLSFDGHSVYMCYVLGLDPPLKVLAKAG